MSTDLEKVSTALADFDRVGAGLAELASRYAGVIYPVSTTGGMNDAKAARAAIREPRYEVEKVRKDAKAPLLALGKRIDSEAARITSELLKIETPIDEQIKAEEARKEAEKQARIAAEQKRVADLQQRVAELRGNPSLSAASGSATIAEHIADLDRAVIDESFEEYAQQAAGAKAAGLERLNSLHAAAIEHEAEQARLVAERAELDRLRAEAAKREAEDAERQAAVRAEIEKARAEQAKRDAEERAKIAEEEKQSHAAIEAERAELQRQRAVLVAEQEAAEALRAAQATPPEVRSARPTDDEIVAALMTHFRADRNDVIEWLAAFGRRAAA